MPFSCHIIFGPTASGKTARALQLAQDTGANLLSYDSRQIYRGMDIGTGKDIPSNYHPVTIQSNQTVVYAPSTVTPTTWPHFNPELLKLSPLPLIFGLDIVAPNQPFSIRHYFEYARDIISLHRQAQQPLIMVGGSWPYAAVVIQPPVSLYTPPQPDLRQQLNTLTITELQAQVAERQPQRWLTLNNSDRANPRRLQRLLEISPSSIAVDPLLHAGEYTVELLSPSLSTIEEKIRARIRERWEQGMVAETQQLQREYPDWSAPAFTATGYQVMRAFLNQEITEAVAAQELWFRQERQYAKRQLTWLKKITNLAK